MAKRGNGEGTIYYSEKLGRWVGQAVLGVQENGKPKRTDYRKFRIKSVEGPNDYASMEEVLTGFIVM